MALGQRMVTSGSRRKDACRDKDLACRGPTSLSMVSRSLPSTFVQVASTKPRRTLPREQGEFNAPVSAKAVCIRELRTASSPASAPLSRKINVKDGYPKAHLSLRLFDCVAAGRRRLCDGRVLLCTSMYHAVEAAPRTRPNLTDAALGRRCSCTWRSLSSSSGWSSRGDGIASV